jgi:hypothetical protein
MKLDNNSDLKNILQDKNELIIRQTRRIRLLEEKLSEVKQKYIHLKGSLNLMK